MHVFPQLRKLERKYADELVVIGVHSPKFPAEKETPNLRQAVLRYHIEHPVVNDRDFNVWHEWGCRAWPTLMLIDPRGKVVGKHEGEIEAGSFDRVIASMVDEFDRLGLVDRRKLALRREREARAGLAFPGKVLADAASGRLFISDSNHDRILVADLHGRVQEVVGDGKIGLQDGGFARARFNRPQGLALVGETLYVADTENYALRAVDLRRRTVTTLAGTGEQARGFDGATAGRTRALNSPWDLVALNGNLYIAMAGFHQLWRLDLASGELAAHAGSGWEGLQDGPLATASLAQPSGIATDGRTLYFADSETSAIRMAEPTPSGRVRTLVGQGLFDYGDVDGIGPAVRLQHPLGLCFHQGTLYVTDSYNNKIKRLDPTTRACGTWLGGEEHGLRDGRCGEARFYEPGGLSVAAGRLYIADTNNHAIRVAALETGEVVTLEMQGLG